MSLGATETMVIIMRDAAGMETISGMKYLASTPNDEEIISMMAHDGELFVVTKNHLYVLVDNKRLELVE